MLSSAMSSHSYLTQIRNVGLLPCEKVMGLFTPSNGLIAEPTSAGRLLITTNQRIISFSEDEETRETAMFAIEDVKSVTVKKGSPNSLSIWQGLMMIFGGLVLYFVVSYWLTGRIDGPNLPLINIDLGPFIILVGLLAGGWVIWKHYFSQGGGVVEFQGSNWAFSFLYDGEDAAESVFKLVESVFDARNARVAASVVH